MTPESRQIDKRLHEQGTSTAQLRSQLKISTVQEKKLVTTYCRALEQDIPQRWPCSRKNDERRARGH